MSIELSQDNIDKLANSPSLISVLIQLEDFMDQLDLYAHANWIDGEVVEGPTISRYWIGFKLKYPYNKMPDPAGGLRLIKHGATVAYAKRKVEVALPIVSNNDYQPGTRKPKMTTETVWIIEINIPRKFIDDPLRVDIDGDD